MKLSWAASSTATVLALNTFLIGAQGRFGTSLRCNGSRGNRELTKTKNEKVIEPEFLSLDQINRHRDLHWDDADTICRSPSAIQTCYIFKYNPDLCFTTNTCSELCNGICAEYLSPGTCMLEPCFGLGCGLTPSSPNLPNFPEGTACHDIIDCYNRPSQSPGCDVDICGVYPDSDACAYIIEQGLNATGVLTDYSVPCPCHVEQDEVYEPDMDPAWPGSRPFPGSSTVTLNVKTDDYPGETFWIVRRQNGDNWDFVAGGGFASTAKQALVSVDFDIEPTNVYEVIFTDSFGDGFFSDAFGLGWYSVTGPFEEDDEGIVMTDIANFTYQMEAYFQTDGNGHPFMIGDYDGNGDYFGGSPTTYDDDLWYYDDFFEGCFTEGCFDPATDDEQWPGAFPGQADTITANIRTDTYPEETFWSFQKLNDFGTFDVIQSGDFPADGDYFDDVVTDDGGNGEAALEGPSNEYTHDHGDGTGAHSHELHFDDDFFDDDFPGYDDDFSWDDDLAYQPHPAATSLFSYTFNVERETIYKLHIQDAFGDGTCCWFGYGWYTINHDVSGTVYSGTGEFTSDLEIAIWVDADGYVYESTYVEGVGYAIYQIILPDSSFTPTEASFQTLEPEENPDKPRRSSHRHHTPPSRRHLIQRSLQYVDGKGYSICTIVVPENKIRPEALRRMEHRKVSDKQREAKKRRHVQNKEL